MQQASLDKLRHLLTAEEALLEALKETRAALRLSSGREKLLQHLHEFVQSDDLSLIVATEKEIIQGDLSRYANSTEMVNSLKAAMEGMEIVEQHIALVSDKTKYRLIDQTHRMAKNRKAGLPFDEARQALAGHQARLRNMDKSRLDEADKQLIKVRKAVIANAIERYTQRQAQILGIEPTTRDSQG